MRLRRGHLIDTSNLHIGGGVQVGASVVNEIAQISAVSGLEEGWFESLTVLVSPEVARNLEPATWDSGISIVTGSSAPRRWAALPAKRYESILTVFGPTYRPRSADREIVGFALPRLIYSLTDVGLPAAPLRERLENKLRWIRFAAADVLITETDDSAHRISAHLPKVSVQVVPNCVSRSVSDRSVWRRASSMSSLQTDALILAAVARDYPHKNLDFLPSLGSELERLMNRRVRFAVTLSDEEWLSKAAAFHDYAVNVGVLGQRELGFLYEACAATVFPSLLEVSSATPLESLSLGVPVFASDLPSMRSAYGDVAVYFNPWDAEPAAQTIAPNLSSEGLAQLRARARAWAVGRPDPGTRARRYLQMLWDT